MKEDFKRVGRLLFLEGLVYSHGGSLSAKNGDKLLITRSGAMLGELRDEDILEVELTDDKAHKELPIHREVYKQSGAQALVHAQPAAAVAISITDNKIVPQDAEGLGLFRAAPIVRARNEETARMLPNFLSGDSAVAVVKGEGSYATGRTLEEAYKLTSCLENSCKIIVAVRSSGQPRPSQQPMPQHKDRSMHRSGPAIPPGIGVMDRSRYHKR